MHTHILIPTDGSELSDEAIQYGTALAKAVNAKVTGVTVSSPFHFLSVEPDMIADTLESYRERMTTVAAQRLAKVKQASDAAGSRLRGCACRARASLQSDYRRRQ